MIIKFSPQLRLETLSLHLAGDVLTINAVTFDFSDLPEGATLPRPAVGCDFLASDVARADGEIVLTLILPHGPEAPEAARFPEPIHITRDGTVALPGQGVQL